MNLTLGDDHPKSDKKMIIIIRNERTKVISWRGNLGDLALWGRQRLHLSSSNQSSYVSLCFTSSPLSFSHSTPLSRNPNASSDPLLSIPSRPYSSLPFLIWRAQVRNPNSSFHLLFPCLFHRYLPFFLFFIISTFMNFAFNDRNIGFGEMGYDFYVQIIGQC